MPKVRVAGTGSEMQGVARLEDGRAVFIPYALPDEEVEIEIVRQKERYAQARLIRVIKENPSRIAPNCPYYGLCGGCQTRHMSYAYSLSLEQKRVYDALTRIGGLIDPAVFPVLPSVQKDGYRNKAEYACSGSKIGFCQEGSANIINTEKCLLQSDSVNALMAALRPKLRAFDLSGIVVRHNSFDELMLIFCLKKPDARLNTFAKELAASENPIKSVYTCILKPSPTHALDGNCVHLAGSKKLNEKLCGLHFSISPKSFFQVNRLQAERLYDTALAFAELKPDDSVCDIYCGTGTISLCVSRYCKNVVGIELVPEAIEDACKNAELNNLSSKVSFICANAAEAYPPLSRRKQFNAVFVDPPRKGLDKPVIDALISSPAPKLIYVSCDPSTLARDIKLLSESGVYRFVNAQPVDMFPGTSHVETVVLLSGR